MGGWIVRRTGFAVMSAVALVLAHNLVFLAGYGPAYGEALGRTGHGATWSSAVLIVLGLGVMLLVAAAWRLRTLGVLARAAAREAILPSDRRGFVGHLVRLWPRLTLLTLALFVLQENVEHYNIGEPLPGLGVLLSSEYPNALLIFGVVALVVAIVGALFRWRRDVLLARMAAARPRWRRASGRSVRPSLAWVDGLAGSLLGRRLAVRAPPVAD